MNQFLDALRSLPQYLSILLDTVIHYIKTIYHSIFTVLAIKQIDPDDVITKWSFKNKILYLKYLIIKLLSVVNDALHLEATSTLLNKFKNDETFNKKGTYYLEIHNHNDTVKTICINISLFDIISLKNQLGDKKTDGLYGSKLITKMKIIGPTDQLNITDHIINYCQYEDVQITLKDVLFCENIDVTQYDEIYIEYIDYGKDLESKTDVGALAPYLHKNIYNIL
jgi:hypothetical protein